MGKLNEASVELTGGDVLSLGDRAKDKLSAATGTVTAITYYLYDAPRVGISLDTTDPSKPPEIFWLEPMRLERLDS